MRCKECKQTVRRPTEAGRNHLLCGRCLYKKYQRFIKVLSQDEVYGKF